MKRKTFKEANPEPEPPANLLAALEDLQRMFICGSAPWNKLEAAIKLAKRHET